MDYIEIPGDLPGYKNHWWGTFGPRLGTDCVNMPPIFTFFQRHKRVTNPKEVHYSTVTLRFNKAYWVEINEMEKLYQIAEIHARATGGSQVNIQCENICQFTLSLNDAPVDLNVPITIKVNDIEAFSGMVPQPGEITLRWDEAKGKFSRLEEPLEGLQKRPDLFGPTSDAYNSKFIIVYGTQGGDSKEVKANREVALLSAVKWDTWAHGNCEVKEDTEVSSEDIESANLILIGNPKSNAILAQINDKLPIRFEGKSIVMDDKRFTGKDVGLNLIYPNPLNPDRHVLVRAGVNWRGTKLVPWLERRLPDYVVFDGGYKRMGWASFKAAGFFDGKWKLSK
jgi:hypothetical protein